MAVARVDEEEVKVRKSVVEYVSMSWGRSVSVLAGISLCITIRSCSREDSWEKTCASKEERFSSEMEMVRRRMGAELKMLEMRCTGLLERQATGRPVHVM